MKLLLLVYYAFYTAKLGQRSKFSYANIVIKYRGELNVGRVLLATVCGVRFLIATYIPVVEYSK